jgi:ribonuclease Y
MTDPGWGLLIAVSLAALVIGYGVGRLFLARSSSNKVGAAARELEALLSDAEEQVEKTKSEIVKRLQREWDQKQEDFSREVEDTRHGFQRQRQKIEKRQERQDRRTSRLNEREAHLLSTSQLTEQLLAKAEQYQRDSVGLFDRIDRVHRQVEEKDGQLSSQLVETDELKRRLESKQKKLDNLIETHARRLEEVTGITRDEAQKRLSELMESEARLESAAQIKEIRDEARLTATREARRVVLSAIQRSAATYTVENTVSVVNLDSDEMKGRIIGREGRNIRAFESATGTEVIVDDTPEAVIISGFDPVRRAIASIALARLIQDGRIHPARIEEVVGKVTEEIEEEIVETGERTVIDLALHGVHPELIRLIGRMRYRSSYGQNLLSHSIEVAKLSSLMASELQLDARKARRAGLLHDIGKVVEGDLESPHAIVGMELCRKYKEDPEVCNAVGAHHDETEMTSPLSPLIQASDAISGARPGARREALEGYIKRLEKLEELASSFDGVERVYAIQAGRELRVIVNHQLVSDALAEQLANDISKRIEQEMQYPGQIRVTVIREVRSVAFAK